MFNYLALKAFIFALSVLYSLFPHAFSSFWFSCEIRWLCIYYLTMLHISMINKGQIRNAVINHRGSWCYRHIWFGKQVHIFDKGVSGDQEKNPLSNPCK